MGWKERKERKCRKDFKMEKNNYGCLVGKKFGWNGKVEGIVWRWGSQKYIFDFVRKNFENNIVR